jgi:Ti-type conjugative transfer relaxase TraA
MAIAFARLQYVSRSSGGNSCLKSAYNERSKMTCERSGQTFFFGHRDGNVHHEVLLPKGADSKFNQSSLLWNEAESAEKRSNSQVAKDMVIALPDDDQITLEDKISLSREFVSENFVDKGLAVQLDIHAPHENERNWHAHLLITTRRFTKDGQNLGEKARDLDAEVRSSRVIEGEIWGEKWKDCQNQYFKKKGYELSVDETGIIPQVHLGPIRMRQFMGDSEIGLRSDLVRHSNEQLSKDATAVLGFLTRNKATFTEKDVDLFLKKHTDISDRNHVKQAIFEHPSLIQLQDLGTEYRYETYGKDLFTTQEIREEEKRIVRYANKIHANNGIKTSARACNSVLGGVHLNTEQEKAYRTTVGRNLGREKAHQDDGLVIIQGRAGTGKSYTLSAIRQAYEKDTVNVIGLAPTNTVAQDLANDAGFTQAKTVHKMLFDHKNGRDSLPKGSVLIVDEAGMLPNDALTELLYVAEKSRSKVILVGDDRQLASVSRGGMFGYLAEKYGAVELTEIRRQEIDWQKDVSKCLSEGKTGEALDILDKNGRLHWHQDRKSAIQGVVDTWAKNNRENPEKSQLVITHTNSMVYEFNSQIRSHLKTTGKFDEKEYECLTATSKYWARQRFSEGDRIQFTQTDKKLGISNGILGTLQEVRPKEQQKEERGFKEQQKEERGFKEQQEGHLREKTLDQKNTSQSLSSQNSLSQKQSYEFVVKQDNGKEVAFNPEEFHGFMLGYASTVYKAQGKTKPLVSVYHDGKGSQSLTYVALTRQKEDLHLFTSREVAKDHSELTRQMSQDEGKKASLHYVTLADIDQERDRSSRDYQLQNLRQQEGAVGFFLKHTLKDKVIDTVKEIKEELVTKTKDYFHKNDVFYALKEDREQTDLKGGKTLYQGREVQQNRWQENGDRITQNRRVQVSREMDRIHLEKSRSSLECNPQKLKEESQRSFGGPLDKTVKLYTPAIQKEENLMRHQKEIELQKQREHQKERGRGFELSL